MKSRTRLRLGVVLLAAASLAVALVAASQLGAREPGGARAEPAPMPTPSLFRNVPQRGAVLGNPAAPVTLVEYADLQCPYCATWAVGALPVLVDEYVRSGKLRIVFRGMAFLGVESDTALRTAVAAGRQNMLWNVVHALYERQGAENSGWVTESLLAEVAPGVDVNERYEDWVSQEVQRSAAAARAARVAGTPAFQVGRTGGRLRLVEVQSLEAAALRPAIDAALAG
ncbi:MAG: DsbA family protein [Gaiellaceae bacterium]